MREVYVVCRGGNFNVLTVFDDIQIAKQYTEQYNEGKSFAWNKALILTRMVNHQPTEEEVNKTLRYESIQGTSK